jgi:hypothetical protein
MILIDMPGSVRHLGRSGLMAPHRLHLRICSAVSAVGIG